MNVFPSMHTAAPRLFRPGLTLLTPLFLCVCVVLLRAMTLEIPDLTDPTESRYASVAQEIIYSGNWLTPQIPRPSGVQPYLGKPPLHFWLTAASYELLGFEEWTSRLPSFLAFLVICGCVFAMGRAVAGREYGLIATLICATSGLLYFLAGTSLVDVTLSAWITAALTSFFFWWRSSNQTYRSPSGILFFAFTALATLTKGPIGVALVGLPIILWLASTREIMRLKKLPWLLGILSFLLITVPWFVLAERANPGFLRYFFINENFERYLVKDYGDRYGTGHVYPRGSVWWMLALSFLPWTPILALLLYRIRPLSRDENSQWLNFFLLWGISPGIFFTFVRQLHAAYVLPGVGGLAIACALALRRYSASGEKSLEPVFRPLFHAALFLTIASVIVGYVLEGDLFYTAWAMIPAVLVLYMAKSGKAEGNDSRRLVSCFSGACAAMFAAFIISATPHANKIKSTEQILDFLTRHTAEAIPEVAVMGSNTYSYYFYEGAWQNELSKPVNIIPVKMNDIKASPIHHVLLKTKDLQYVPEDIRNLFDVKKAIGNWTLLIRKSAIAKS